ncbi:hypothetical protein B0H13DRAFT_1918200 [Mycena leptocephala]|nr:hypothetical protein B0H13DRAFT_1918200 [Mycena leptocephala]
MSGENSGISGKDPAKPLYEGTREELFSADAAMKILRKMELDRMERNKKRGDRREAREENVTDDEADELSPFLMVVPSGEKSQPDGGLATVPESTDTSPPSKLLFDDHVAEKNSFHAHDNAIYSLAKNGISPPLTLFLPASLGRIRSSNVKTIKHGTGETTRVTTLDQATFLTCYNTFLTLLESAAGERIVRSFASHYNTLLADPELRVWFPAVRDFDRKIRAQFFTSPYIIDVPTAHAFKSCAGVSEWQSRVRRKAW